MLITFNKILDPTSVVRESEYARTAEGVSLIENLKGKALKLEAGGAGVTVSELEAFERTAKEFIEKAGKSYVDSEQERFGRIADSYNIPRDLIFGDYSAQPAQAAAPDHSALSDAELLKQLQGY